MVNNMYINLSLISSIVLTTIFILLLIVYLILFLRDKINNTKNEINLQRIDKFPSYLSLLEHYTDLSYQIIYKERIMVYSIEASRLPENELNAVARDFISLTLKFLGPNLTNEFIKLYGDAETLYFVIGQKFYLWYEDDKIREGSTDDMMNYEMTDEEQY